MKRFSILTVALVLVILLGAVQLINAGTGDDKPITGKVLETMNSGGYTYVLLDSKGEKVWVAVPEMKVAKGQKMSFMPGTVMQNFESKTLKRTFKKIIFSEGPLGK